MKHSDENAIQKFIIDVISFIRIFIKTYYLIFFAPKELVSHFQNNSKILNYKVYLWTTIYICLLLLILFLNNLGFENSLQFVNKFIQELTQITFIQSLTYTVIPSLLAYGIQQKIAKNHKIKSEEKHFVITFLIYQFSISIILFTLILLLCAISPNGLLLIIGFGIFGFTTSYLHDRLENAFESTIASWWLVKPWIRIVSHSVPSILILMILISEVLLINYKDEKLMFSSTSALDSRYHLDSFSIENGLAKESWKMIVWNKTSEEPLFLSKWLTLEEDKKNETVASAQFIDQISSSEYIILKKNEPITLKVVTDNFLLDTSKSKEQHYVLNYSIVSQKENELLAQTKTLKIILSK